MNTCRKLRAVALLTFILTVKSFSLDEKAIVDGAAQFLMERAQQNYIYLFQNKISSDRFFCWYFPKTREAIELVSLPMLLMNRGYLKECIVADMENLRYTAVKPTIDSLVGSIAGNFQALRNIANVNSSRGSTIDSSSLARDLCLLQASLLETGKMRAFSLDSMFGRIEAVSRRLTSPLFDSLIAKYENLLTDSAFQARVRGKGMAAFIGDREFFLASAPALKARYDTIQAVCDSKRSFASRMIAALDIIQMTGNNAGNRAAFREFKKYCLFFAQLCDAQDAATVKQMLVNVSLPPVSYHLKRAESTFSVFINGYFGVSGGWEFDGGNDTGYYGLAAPVGIELAWGSARGFSMGLFLSMLDLGKAVNAQIYKEETPKVADIVAPGIGICLGAPTIPLSLAIRYSFGMGIRSDSKGINHVSGEIAFDMPLVKMLSMDISDEKSGLMP